MCERAAQMMAVEHGSHVVPHGAEGVGQPASVATLLLDPEGEEGIAEGGADPSQEGARPQGRSHHRGEATGHLPAGPAVVPGLPGLDGGRDDQQQADRSYPAGDQPGQRRPPPSPGAQGQEGHRRTEQQGPFGVPQDQGVRRRGQGEQPDGPPGQVRVPRLSLHEDDQDCHAGQGAGVGHGNDGHAGPDPRDPSEGPGNHREHREEPEGFLPRRRVAVPGDGLVPAGVPPQESLVHAGSGGRVMGPDRRDGQPGEHEGADHDDAAQPPRRQGHEEGVTEGPLPVAHQTAQGVVGAYCTSPMGW